MQLKNHLIAAAVLCAALGAQAQAVRIANQGDSLSMDPHSLNESLQLSVTGNVYEGLVGRNKDLSVAPGLATSWSLILRTSLMSLTLARMSEPSPAARWNENTTSSALKGVPSWNCTFLRSSKRHTVGEVCFHEVASAGARLRSLPRPTSASYTLPVTDSCSDSLSECGSIDRASPWLAMRTVCAPAPSAAHSKAVARKLLIRMVDSCWK